MHKHIHVYFGRVKVDRFPRDECQRESSANAVAPRHSAIANSSSQSTADIKHPKENREHLESTLFFPFFLRARQLLAVPTSLVRPLLDGLHFPELPRLAPKVDDEKALNGLGQFFFLFFWHHASHLRTQVAKCSRFFSAIRMTMRWTNRFDSVSPSRSVGQRPSTSSFDALRSTPG